ncbi:MAG: hypothetical protein OXC07_13280 [Kistimonas sp.]|nr:hypothetical protein [Kistimonas sp.]
MHYRAHTGGDSVHVLLKSMEAGSLPLPTDASLVEGIREAGPGEGQWKLAARCSNKAAASGGCQLSHEGRTDSAVISTGTGRRGAGQRRL